MQRQVVPQARASLGQIGRSEQTRRLEFDCKVLRVSYVNRRLKVAAEGYSGPAHVPVAAGIALGRPDRPIILPGCRARVVMKKDGSWEVTSITRTRQCLIASNNQGEVEVDTSVDIDLETEFDLNVSPLSDDFGSITLPDDIFLRR